MSIEACERPVYHVDHPEQQRGRLHMPPYSESGYDNPDDWGLAGAGFSTHIPRIQCCPTELARSFSRVDWPPLLAWPEGFNGLAHLHDRALTRDYDSVVFCGLCDALVGFAASLDLRPGQARMFDDGEKETTDWRQRLKWNDWPALRPEPGVLHVVPGGSSAETSLMENGAAVGEDLLVVDPHTWRTYSPLRRALSACASDPATLIVLGFGEPGRLIADWLWRQSDLAAEVRVWDDAPTTRGAARERGLRLIEPDQIVGARGGQLIVISADPRAAGQVLADRLRSQGLLEWRDWIARPFARAGSGTPLWPERASLSASGGSAGASPSR
jgi:hypothetical protein